MEAQAQQADDDETERLRRMGVTRFGSRIRHFRVLAHGSGLVLRGVVGSFHLKQMVQEAVFGATTLRVAANEIVVD